MAMISVEEALDRVLASVGPLDVETVPLADALGRITAEPVAARLTQPPFPASAMDGYAVRSADVASLPAELKVIGEVPAGRPFAGTVGPHQAVRIFTGGVVPEGADAIVIQEDTRVAGDNRVRILEGAVKGRYIRPRGLDFSEGEALIDKGRRLLPRDIAIAAAMNVPQLPVVRRPRVAIVATGDELVVPGSIPGPGQIISSNGYGLSAFVRVFGGEPLDLGIARDSLESLEEAIAGAAGADILVTLGGASVGDHDLVREALGKAGLDLDFWRIAMRPGKPLMFGRIGGMRAMGLPGNPVSALICARIFLKPLLDRMLGVAAADTSFRTAPLGAALPANDQRQDYLRARLVRENDGPPVALPFERQDSSMLRALAEADCLIVRPPHAPAAAAGETVEILNLDF